MIDPNETRPYSLDEGAKHFVGGKPVESGYILHLTSSQAHALRDRVTLSEGPESEPVEEAPKELTVAEKRTGLISENTLPDIEAMSAAEACKLVKAIDNMDILLDLFESEERKTVSTAIEKRLEKLGEK